MSKLDRDDGLLHYFIFMTMAVFMGTAMFQIYEWVGSPDFGPWILFVLMAAISFTIAITLKFTPFMASYIARKLDL